MHEFSLSGIRYINTDNNLLKSLYFYFYWESQAPSSSEENIDNIGKDNFGHKRPVSVSDSKLRVSTGNLLNDLDHRERNNAEASDFSQSPLVSKSVVL